MKRALIGLMLLPLGFQTVADEGMWLFNQPPRQFLHERYQFDVTDAWLEHLQKSCVRFDVGGSGSFVSEDGLIISNHHVGADALQKVSTKEKNLVRDGFYAHTAAEEIKCLDLELNVLDSIEDVTARVNAAVPKEADATAAFEARRRIIAGIEKESLGQTGLRSDVVTLWQGGAYHLYRYKSYTDVRIVFAPEQQIAFYGGDPDNFEFPRYDLDICLFRAYENGKPAKIKNYLHFSRSGAREGDLVLIGGHPGRTSRLLTVSELENIRDQNLPFGLAVANRREVLLANWSARNVENARRAEGDFLDSQNWRKGAAGSLAGLLGGELIPAKLKAETGFKNQLAGRPEFAGALAAYDQIAGATALLATQAVRYALLDHYTEGFAGESFAIARTLLRAGEELPKPNGERLREFSDSGKASLELELFSEKPIYTDLEILMLADSLTCLAGELGANDPLVSKVLAGRSLRSAPPN